MIERTSITRTFSWIALVLASAFFNSCGNGGEEELDTRERGTIHISVDESFKPIIDSQIAVYESKYPQTRIIAHYKPEADCLRDFAVDSIRMIITTRGYSPEEKKFMNDSMKVAPSRMVIAYDAVALIVHPSSSDTLMKMEDVKQLLNGTAKSQKFPVFDGLKATSTVRFILDSVLRGDSLGSLAVAAESSEKVVDYVARTPNAVGFLGVSWIGNPEDSTQLSYLDKVKVVQLEHPMVPGKYVTPAQFNIYYGRYPLIREVVYVLKEKHRGLAHGFANFLTGQTGQLIFKRAYLMPALQGYEVRDATISE